MAKITKEQVVEFIENMTVLEMSEFVKELEEKFGVSAAAPVAVAAAPAAGEAAAEEQTEFDVILTSYGEKQINFIITAISPVTNLSKNKGQFCLFIL